MSFNQEEKRKIIIENFNNPVKQISLVELKKKANNSQLFFFRSLGNCGDIIYLFVETENNFIKKIFFATDGQACYLTVASANIFCSWMEKKTVQEVKNEIVNVESMLEEKNYQLTCSLLEIFSNLNKFSSRLECVNLIIRSVKQILILKKWDQIEEF